MVVVVPFVNWQVGSLPAEIVMAVGVPTVGVMVTTWVVVAGPLHPAALAEMVVVPLHPAT